MKGNRTRHSAAFKAKVAIEALFNLLFYSGAVEEVSFDDYNKDRAVV